MKGQYIVAGYQGRMNVRFVPDSSTTVYMDEELTAFDTEEEANAYVDQHEEEYYNDYYKYDDGMGDDRIDYLSCEGCGALHLSDCHCDE